MLHVLLCVTLCPCSSFAIILMGKRELVALLNFSSWCLVIVGWLFLVAPWACLRFVIVVFPDHTHLLFKRKRCLKMLMDNKWRPDAEFIVTLLAHP